MKVIVTIDGKEAIPVRALPLLTDWQILSPDVCAGIFSGDDTLQCFVGMTAHRLNPDGSHQLMEQREWVNWVARELRACKERIKAAQASHESGYHQWRQESLALLPAGVFVWREFFEAAHELEYGPSSIRARFNGETFDPSACELNYDLQRGPGENWRNLVMEGFEQFFITPVRTERKPQESTKVVPHPEPAYERQERRLQACIDAGLPMNTNTALLRLPDGVSKVAELEGVTRQAFSADVKAALKRRESSKREGATVHLA